MWSLLHSALANNLAIASGGAFLAGFVFGWLFFRQRVWVMEQRLSDYAERWSRLDAIEVKRLVCPVCRSRALHRSSTRNFSVAVGRAFGRYPYRCERCFSVSLHRGSSTYTLAKRVDTYRDLDEERRQFEEDLRIAQKMKRLYPEKFRPEEIRQQQPRA